FPQVASLVAGGRRLAETAPPGPQIKGSAVVDDRWQDRQLAGESRRAASGPTLPAEVHQASLGLRRDSPGEDSRCLHLPLTSTEPGGLLTLGALRIPHPEYPIKTPAGCRSSTSEAPGGQPDSAPGAGPAGMEQLRLAAGGGLAVPAVSQRGNVRVGEH